MKLVKFFGVLFSALTMLSLTGCWNYREVDSLYIVSGMAVDVGEQGYKYHATYQYLKISGGSEASAKPALIETDGDTLFDTARNAITKSESKLFFSDCKVFIVSKKLAEEGLTPLLDWINRDAETRITMELIISTEEKAGDILQQEEGSDEITGFSINKMVENSTNLVGISPDVAVYQANNMLKGKGISLIAPSIATLKEEEKIMPVITGTSVFKEDKLIGFLDENDSRYLLYIKDQIKGGLQLTNVASDEANITLEIFSNSTSCNPSITDGIPHIKIDVETKVAFAEENSGESILNNYGVTEVEACAENTIKEGIENVIEKVKSQYKSDIFGFGSCIYKSYPDYWKEHEAEWDTLFQETEVEVEVKVKIENTATANPKKDS